MIHEPLTKRRAYRALAEKPIPAEVLHRLADAAHLAPSCMNSQPWRLVTVSGPKTLPLLKEALSPGNYWACKAPAITAFVTHLDWDSRLDQGRDYALFDTGQAVMSYQVQAITEGLYVHPIAGFDSAKAKTALNIPTEYILITLVILGWPGSGEHLNEKHREQEASARVRKPIEAVYANDLWNSQVFTK